MSEKRVFLTIPDALSGAETQIAADTDANHRADADDMYVFEGDLISDLRFTAVFLG